MSSEVYFLPITGQKLSKDFAKESKLFHVHTSNINIGVLGNTFQSWNNPVYYVFRIHILYYLTQLQTRNASDFRLNVIDVFDHVCEKGLKLLWSSQHLCQLLHF